MRTMDMKSIKTMLKMGVAASVLLTAAPALAQQADDAASSGIEDIVVTARKQSESVQSVPVAITAVSAEQMIDRSVRDITDIAASTPSFFTQMSSADPSALLVSMRGQSATDTLLTLDSPVGVYVDGVYLPRAIGLRAAMVDIERVEVLRGPQGTLFGKNTTGGAVSITTRQADVREVGGFVSMVLGEHGKMEATGALNVPLVRDVLAVRVMGQYSGLGGYGKNGLGDSLGGEITKTGRINVAFTPGDRLKINLSGDYQKIKGDGIITRLAWLNPLSPEAGSTLSAPNNLLLSTMRQLGWAETPENRARAYALLQESLIGNGKFHDSPSRTAQSNDYEGYGVSGTIAYDLSDYMTVKSITANRWANRDSVVDFDGTPILLWEPAYKTRSKAFSQELQLLSDPAERFSWILGGYYSKETGTELSESVSIPLVSPTNPAFSDGSATNKSIAAFGQANFRVSDAVRLTAGLRWTEETKSLETRNRNARGCNIPVDIRVGGATGPCVGYLSDKYSDWSYLFSVDWTVDNGKLIYARTSRGFKGGGQNIRGSGTDPRTFDPFKPEVVTDYEIGAKLDLLDRRLRLNLAGYHAIYENIQRSTSIQPAGQSTTTTLITNAGKARINGVEAEITAQPVDAVTFSVNSSYTDPKYKVFADAILGDRRYERFPIPRWTVAANMTVRQPTSFGEVKFIGGWNWRSATQLRPAALVLPTVTQKAYGLVDARINLHFDVLDADIAVFAKNLLDKDYIVGAVDLDRSLGYNIANVGAPRLIGVELRKSFGSR